MMNERERNCYLVLFFIWIITICVFIFGYPNQFDDNWGKIVIICMFASIFILWCLNRIIDRCQRRNEPILVEVDSPPAYTQVEEV